MLMQVKRVIHEEVEVDPTVVLSEIRSMVLDGDQWLDAGGYVCEEIYNGSHSWTVKLRKATDLEVTQIAAVKILITLLGGKSQ